MASGIQGKYYSATLTSASVAYGDLIEQVETAVGESVSAKKMTLISSGSITLNINGGTDSTLFENSDGEWVLSFDARDMLVSSLKIKETSASGIYLALIY